MHRDADGRWRRFSLPGSSPPSFALRLASLEDGRAMVAWDTGDRIDVQMWDRRGTVGPAQTVLDGIVPSRVDSGGWQLAADRRGTVVIAAPAGAARTPGAVYATLRDPGGAFGAAQQLTPHRASDRRSARSSAQLCWIVGLLPPLASKAIEVGALEYRHLFPLPWPDYVP